MGAALAEEQETRERRGTVSDFAIEASNLTKTFSGGRVAVSSLDLGIPSGTVYGLLGRNGSGKSTAIRLLLGLLKADSGTARILGDNLWAADRAKRAQVGYVSQHPQLPGWMTLQDLGRYVSHLYPTWNQPLFENAADRCELPMGQPVGRLSAGELRKSATVLALAPQPGVLLLDEPTAGLDSIAKREFVTLLVELLADRPETTIVLSTHDVGDLGRLANTVGVMDRGRLVLSHDVEDLQQTTRKVQVIYPDDHQPEPLRFPGLIRQETVGSVVTAVCRLANDQQLDFLKTDPGIRVEVFPMGIEDIFVEVFESVESTLLNEARN